MIPTLSKETGETNTQDEFQSRNRETYDSNLNDCCMRTLPLQFQSRNRETYDSNGDLEGEECDGNCLFQSRNRETYDSNITDNQLVVWITPRFQSRNRETYDSNRM